MAIKSPTYEPKVGRGIGLKPSLWQRIDDYAEQQCKSRNQVIEEVLTAYIPIVPDLHNPRESSQDAQPKEVVDLPL